MLFPLVPVTAITCCPPRSATHNAVAVVVATPRAANSTSSGLWIETPGERTRTSQLLRAATAASGPTIAAASHHGSLADSLGSSRTTTVSRARGTRSVSCRASERASRPRPHTPTVLPSRSEKRIHLRKKLRRYLVVAAQRKHGLGVRGLRRKPRQDLAREPPYHPLISPPRVVGEQPDRREHFDGFADALERLVPTGGGEQREAGVLPFVVEHCAAEDPPQSVGLHERREHQEHEPALVAVAAPRRQSQRRVELEDRGCSS